jgi:branched-chain amino acid transport system permease protein
LLALFIKKSLLGKAFRAWETTESKIALIGVNQAGLGKKAMAIGFGFAGLAGAFFALSYSFSIHEGLDMTIKALCLAVIAGTLSPLSVYAFGLLMGVGESWIAMIIGSQWSPVLSYTLFLLILRIRG